MEKLKECPFCGKKVAKYTTAAELEMCVKDVYCYEADCTMKAVVCGVQDGGCGASTGFFTSEEEAVTAWNRRADNVTG